MQNTSAKSPIKYPAAPGLPAERVLGLFMNKWAIKVIHRLAASDERPSNLRRLLRPISQKVLTQTLRSLEDSGFVRREMVRPKPLNVKYSLTPLGRTFVQPLNDLCRWALAHEAELNEAARRMASSGAARQKPQSGLHAR